MSIALKSGSASISMHQLSGGSLNGTWSTDVATATVSDITKKNSIKNLSIEYDLFFNTLEPVQYKFNNGTSNRIHTGFIAQ
jgi:hypothetical protein